MPGEEPPPGGLPPGESSTPQFAQLGLRTPAGWVPLASEQPLPAPAKRGMGKLKLGEARKAIRDYRKATGNTPGTAEQLMTYVENGVKFTDQDGDMDERFYNSMESGLGELAALLRGEARELYPQFSERLARVEQMTDGIGWGFHDFVADVVGQLEDELGAQ